MGVVRMANTPGSTCMASSTEGVRGYEELPIFDLPEEDTASVPGQQGRAGLGRVPELAQIKA